MPDLPTLSLSSLVVRRDGHIEAEIDNEIVALNIETGACYGLNSVASRIWGLVETPVRVSDVCAKLVSEFEVDPAVCEAQVLDLLEELRTEGIIATPEEK